MADFGLNNNLYGHFCRCRYFAPGLYILLQIILYLISMSQLANNFSSVSTYLDVHSDQTSPLYYFV